MSSFLKNLTSVLLTVFLPQILFAQEMGGSMMGEDGKSCCGSMGAGGMVLRVALVLAVIGALIALSVFLFRRSRV